MLEKVEYERNSGVVGVVIVCLEGQSAYKWVP